MAKPKRSSVPSPLYRTPDPVDVPGAWFDQDAVDKVVAFGRFCRHTKGRWAGRPIEFEPWQIEHFIAPIFGWKYPDGRRIRRTGYLEVAKKNGKSTMSSVLALYLAGPDDEPGAEVYAAATAKDQARFVFEPARSMVERSPELAKRYKRYRNSITYAKNDGLFAVVSADAGVQDGANVHAASIDELHRHKTRHLVDILEYGTASRDQPLVYFITTAGEDDETTIYAEKHNYCIRVAQGLVRDPSFFGAIFAAEPGDDPGDRATWAKANPNLGVSVTEEYLQTKANEAINEPGKLNAFLRFHCNIRTRQVIRWLPLTAWDECHELVDEEQLAGESCYAGVVVTRSQDVNAYVLVFPRDDGTYIALHRFFLPAGCLAAVDERTADMGSRWAREGFIQLTDGDVTDPDAITKRLRADAERFDIREMAFNRRGSTQIATDLAAEGLDVIAMSPGISLAAATEEWGRLILCQGFKHGGQPVARWMFDGLSMKQDKDGNVWPDTGASRTNISGPVAAVMALDRATRTAELDYSEAVW